MVRIKPFRAYRPPPELAAEVAAPPYDVLDSSEAREACKFLSNKTFLRVNKPEIDLPDNISQYDETVYQKGLENLCEFISNGWLIQDRTPSIYIYAQKLENHVQYGICAGVPVEDYALGLIKRHEKTKVKKENDRTRLTYTQNANVGPVFLTYRDSAALTSMVSALVSLPPEVNFEANDGVRHMIWPVTDPFTIRDIQKLFEEIPHCYIADGHHRSASAYRVGEMKIKEAISSGNIFTGDESFAHFLAVLFPASELKIMEYNRVVKDLNGYTPEEFLLHVSKCFEVQELSTRPQKMQFRRQIGMCLKSQWFQLTVKPHFSCHSDPVSNLDVQILYDQLLQPVLGIGDLRSDERIQFVGGIRGSAELECLVTRSNDAWAVAFLMHPVSLEEVMNISDADKLMPPKATWFEPKLRSGLIVRMLD